MRKSLHVVITSLSVILFLYTLNSLSSLKKSSDNNNSALNASKLQRMHEKRSKEIFTKPGEHFILQRMWPDETLNMEAVNTARLQSEEKHSTSSELDELWTFAGPDNVGGRITALAVHPLHPDTVYAGAALGGVFKSIDGGYNYTPVFQEDFAMSIGALAIDPENPMKIWVGTGEANASGDSYPGNGIYVSENGGLSWTNMGLINSGCIGRIAIDPTDPDRIFVAATGYLFAANPERGCYRTTDGGQNWEQVLFLTDSTACIDVDINPLNPDTVYATMWERIRHPWGRTAVGITSGIHRSYDGGDTWELLDNGLPQHDQVGRGGLAIAPSNPSRVYSIIDGNGGIIGIFRSDDYGDSWEQVSNTGGRFYSTFGWYFGNIEVSPNNDAHVFVLGVEIFRSYNSGQSWEEIFWDAHVDHHALWINPYDATNMIVGHDGGIDVSTDGGNSSARFESLPVTQFYNITHDPNHPERLMGGTQDNSTPRTLSGDPDDWDVLYYGDGFHCYVDPADSDVLYAEYQYAGLARSDNGGNGWYSIGDDFETERTNWNTPYVLDPHDSDRIYLGTHRVWRSNNQGNSWQIISDDLTNGENPYGSYAYGTLTTINVSPADENVIYTGSDDGNIHVSTDQGQSWTNISADLPERYVTTVVPHPDSVSVVYAGFSGFRRNERLPHIWRSSNYGEDWVDVSGDLPEAPINDIVVDPVIDGYIYVGTDFGVFYTSDYGQSWSALGNQLPWSAVMDLEYIPSERILVAGTHGTSMWKYDLTDVGIDEQVNPAIVADFNLTVYPNPFNSQVNIRFSLEKRTYISAKVYDLLGREVKSLYFGNHSPGEVVLHWDGNAENNEMLASGTYILSLKTGTSTLNKKLLLLR